MKQTVSVNVRVCEGFKITKKRFGFILEKSLLWTEDPPILNLDNKTVELTSHTIATVDTRKKENQEFFGLRVGFVVENKGKVLKWKFISFIALSRENIFFFSDLPNISIYKKQQLVDFKFR